MLFKTLSFLLSLVVSTLVLADSFECPKNHITINDGITGKLPAGATSMVKIPAGTNCTYTFDLPKGYALKMETSAVYDISPGDFVKFEYFYILSGEDKRVEYGIQSTLPFQVYSKTGNLTFFATYTYLDVSHYTQKTLPTGTYFNTTLEPNHYYTMQASQGDKATFKLSMLETGFYDHSIYEVFVFDGDNFMEGEYIGRLSRLLKLINFRSDSSSFTFLNLYRTPSTSYVFGNDWSKVKDLAQYNTWVIDPIKETKGYLYNMENKDDAYYTFFCDECTSFYIESLLFDPSISNDSLGYLEVSGMSPTQRLPPILNYTISQFTNSSLPQLISSSIATFHTHKCGIVLKLRLDEKSDWFSTASDKKRTVFSPNLWNPDAEPNFDYTFSDPFKVYNFSINLESVRLVNDGDVLDVEVGSVDGLTTLYRKYTKTSMSNVPIAGVGRYLNLKLAGSKSSEVILNFEMIDQDIGQSTKRDEKITSVIPGSVTTPSENTHNSSTATSSPVQTTTTATSSIFSTSILPIVFIVFFTFL